MCRIRKYLLWLLVPAAASCGPAVGHEIIMEEEGMIMVNLDSKISVAEIKEFTHYYFDDYSDSNFLQVFFCVPSEYPDYPETPWARCIIDGTNQSHTFEILDIYGTQNADEEAALCNIVPTMPGIKGRWYFAEPMLESQYVLIENADDTMMIVYYPHGYSEIDRQQQENFGYDQAASPDPEFYERMEQLRVGDNGKDYFIVPYTEPSYRINDKNELIFLNRQKTYRDTSRCVMQPLPLQ